jgi:putative ABC transport system permease protein
VRLRLQDGVTKRYKTVPFHYAGLAREFPTAPTDSCVVAGASYVAKMTGSDAVGTFLLQTGGSDPSGVARRVRGAVGAGAKVTDIKDSRRVVGSNLTAVELSGLTRVELAFALVLAAAASGLALGLGFRERRRTYSIAVALGAKRRQLGGFVWGESAFVTLGGLAIGAVVAPAVPWGYLVGLVVLTVAAAGAAGAVTMRALRRPAIEELRDL